VSVLKRALTVVGLAAELVGAVLTGWSVFQGGGENGATRASFAYVEQAACTGCPVELRSAEVQARQGSSLFIFGGSWPSAIGDIPGEVRLTANDLDLRFHPSADGFEIVDGAGPGSLVAAEDVAADIHQGALLINLPASAVAAPVRFALELIPGDGSPALIPASGRLLWNGTGAPERLAPEPQAAPTQTPTETSEPTVEPETPEEFASALAEAHRDGDSTFLLDRLHPAVIDRYGRNECADFVESIRDTTRAYEVTGSSDLEPWPYESDGQTSTVEDVYTVSVDATIEGESSSADLHFGLVDDLLHWFTDCGERLGA
jgi:hypothetical protein